jgi:mRNA-degrading endonuclease RelE of RelBE toxin-antitoxin system
MAEAFTVNITNGAEADLRLLSAYARRIVLDGLELHLRHQPTQGTRRIVPLRANPLASWELRLGDYRVLYDVDEASQTVNVLVVGEKRGNRFYVQDREFTSHESDRPAGSESQP